MLVLHDFSHLPSTSFFFFSSPRFCVTVAAACEWGGLWADGSGIRLLTENKRLIEPMADENKIEWRSKKGLLSDMKNPKVNGFSVCAI